MKKSKLIINTILSAALLSGCASSGSQGQVTKLEVKDKMDVTKASFTSEYSPYKIEDDYLILTTGDSFSKYLLDLNGELSEEAVFNADEVGNIVKNKDKTYFSRDGMRGAELFERDDFIKGEGNNLLSSEDRGTVYGTGTGFLVYRNGRCYVDENLNTIKELDDDYSMLWNDQYLIKGGLYEEDELYDYNDQYYYPRVFDASTDSYKAPNDYGEIYDLDENLLVHIDEDSIPCTNANYYLIGENLLLEGTTSENLEYDDPASIRLLDFEMNEVKKIAGAYDYSYIKDVSYLYINIMPGEDAKAARQGTATEDFEPGLYVYDVEKQDFVRDEPIQRLYDIDCEDGVCTFFDNKEEKMYADVIDDYLYLGNGYYLIKCNDECAIVNMLGTFVEEFSDLIDFDSAQDDEGFYYDGLYVELDDVKTKSSFPGTIGYLIFESDVDSLTSTTIYRVI